MKRQECLSSVHSVDTAKLCNTAMNGDASAVNMQPPPKSCRIGIAYWPALHSGSQPESKAHCTQNGLAGPVDRPHLDSSLSEGEQVNVFSVDEVSALYYVLVILFITL